ncbi:TIGR01906 family membrane protein [Auritidibacter ignavus]|uniref:TIGR01906 family membrane protein n=1 Tax=Auritidibacter ignavus TaxID=678932 RepID=UPI002FE65390
MSEKTSSNPEENPELESGFDDTRFQDSDDAEATDEQNSGASETDVSPEQDSESGDTEKPEQDSENSDTEESARDTENSTENSIQIRTEATSLFAQLSEQSARRANSVDQPTRPVQTVQPDSESSSTPEESDDASGSSSSKDSQDSEQDQDTVATTTPVPNFLKDDRDDSGTTEPTRAVDAGDTETSAESDPEDESRTSTRRLARRREQNQANSTYTGGSSGDANRTDTYQTSVFDPGEVTQAKPHFIADYEGLPATAKDDQVAEQQRMLKDAQARLSARDQALEGPKTLSRILQTVLAIIAPIAFLAIVVRAVASPLFLWIEYHRPGFPADEFGLTTTERLDYGSYGLDYLFNLASPNYLASLTFADGSPLFTQDEVSHMADVKSVMLTSMLIGAVLVIASAIIMVVLSRISKGAIRRSLFAASIWLLLVIVVLGVLAIIAWQDFFAGFHALFFADGTWTFYASDTLIRLYPNQFWIDAGLAVGALTVLTAVITLVATWPTKRRKKRSAQTQLMMLAARQQWPTTDGKVTEVSLEEGSRPGR